MQLYDVSGAKVLEQSVENTNRARMQVSDLPAGVYAWALREASGKVWSGKMVMVR
jgi:Secretion system C-terminal sorting domain